MASIAYAQLVAEHAAAVNLAPEITSAIFGLLVADLSGWALNLTHVPQFEEVDRKLITAMIKTPRTRGSDWDAIPLHPQ
jgi:hypothetical protein